MQRLNHFLQFMEYGLSVFKGADMAEDILYDPAGLKAILTHAIVGVGIGTHGDDVAAQVFE